jgi:uncharacterized coiled-coil protein SlyX
MLDATTEQRITNLEELMAQVWRTIDRVDRQIEQTQRQVDQTSREMRVFKDEMRVFKDEMRVFKDEMRVFKDEMRVFKDEMSEFKDEMGEFKEEMRASRIEMNRKWGELANKMGTMAEDLVAPSIPRVLRETVGCPEEGVESLAVRVRRLHPTERGRMGEFDVVAMCGEYVLINETKSSLYMRDVADFVERLPQARDFFPEYADKQFIGAIASLYVDESVVRHGEKHGLIVLGFGEDVMQVLNSAGFVPKTF